MKKLLFLTLTISYALQAITPAQPFIQDTIGYLQEIEPVSIPLSPESQTQVNTWSMVGGLAGAAVGLGACLVLPAHIRPQQSSSDISDNLSIFATGVATAIVGGLSYLGTQWYATSCTPEKTEESKTNNLIYDHNAALNAFNLVDLSAHERDHLSNLPFKTPSVDLDRLAVYQGINAESSKSPIGNRVNNIQNIATNLEQEKYACTKLTASRIAQLHASSLVADAKNIAQTIEQQKEYIMSMNAMIPTQPMKNWCNYVEKQTPEYKVERLQINCNKTYNQLHKYEDDIKWHLARLAALHGCVFSQADLSSNIWHFILSDLSASYSNTPEGQRARQRDIKETKNQIGRLIQDYQNKLIEYNSDIADHNDLQRQVYSPIAQFIIDQGGSTQGLKGLRANKRLLEYNNYLNHSDANVLWHWINSCFDN